MNKVLLVEDEISIRSFLKINLVRSGFDVIEAETGEIALEKVEKENINVAILDVMLPGIDGFRVCKEIRDKFPNIGIIMLTAKGQDTDKINGLENGADDYVVKPFNPIEVILRINAILRRIHNKISDKKCIESKEFYIDFYSQKVLKNNEEVILTPKEYLLLKLFIENPGRAFTRDELLNIVWGENYFGDHKIIDVNIRRLRAKIEDNSSEPYYIQTVWGIGYRWNE